MWCFIARDHDLARDSNSALQKHQYFKKAQAFGQHGQGQVYYLILDSCAF